MLTDLVERSRHSPEHDPPIEHRVSETGVPRAGRGRAALPDHLAQPSRTVTVEILAVDPTETSPTVDALTPHMQHLAREVSVEAREGDRRAGALRRAIVPALRHAREGWRRGGGRERRGDVPGGGIVAVADRGAAVRHRSGRRRLDRLRDAGRMQRHRLGDGDEVLPGARRRRRRRSRPTRPRSSASAASPAVQVSEAGRAPDRKLGRHLGRLVARDHGSRRPGCCRASSSRRSARRSRSRASGFFILRQQRRALALESELRYARAVAAARDLENQLVRAEKLITVGVLSTEMAHEIGSPLAVIRGRAEQVLREVSSGPRAEDLHVIIKHIDNISSTVRQMLDFARRPADERRAVSLQTRRRARARAPGLEAGRAPASSSTSPCRTTCRC